MKQHHFNLRTKLVFYFLLGFVLPIILFGVLLMSLQQRNSEGFIMQSQETSVLHLADRIQQELRSIQSISNLYYLNNDLIDALSAEATKDVEQEISELTRAYSAGLGNLNAEFTVLDTEGRCFNGSSQLQSAARQFSRQVYRPGNLSWFTAYDLENGTGNGSVLYAYRPLHDRNTWQQVGALLISIKRQELLKIYSGYLTESQNAYLIDAQGHVISTVDNQGLTYSIPSRIFPLYSGTFQDHAGSTPQLVSFCSIQSAGLQLVVTSDLTVLRAPYHQTTMLFLAILILYVLLALWVTYIVPKNFVRPIHNLQANIDLVKDGNLDAMVPVTSSDEIGQLSQRYNEMLQRLQDVLDSLLQAQRSQHEAEMHALQAQINPHFIYNTLASIRFLVISQQNQDADRSLVALISILRGTLSDPHRLSTVGQEIKLLQDYIELQRISFSRPLETDFQIEDSVRNCSLCKLTLQPIVENAFLHGFAAGQANCRLRISAQDLNDTVEIMIQDNGCGFDPHAPARSEGADALPHFGLGVDNVSQRLKLSFGPEAALLTESTPGVGTSVTIRIPKQQTQGGTLVYDNSDR